MAKKTQSDDRSVIEDTPLAPAAPVDDAPIVKLILARKTEFEAEALKEVSIVGARKFQSLRIPTSVRLSPEAFTAYREWADARDAQHVAEGAKHVTYGVDADKHVIRTGEKPYEAGDSKLHAVFAGLQVIEDNTLRGDSVIVEGVVGNRVKMEGKVLEK